MGGGQSERLSQGQGKIGEVAGGCLFGGRYVLVCAHPALMWWRTGGKVEGERKEADREQGREVD